MKVKSEREVAQSYPSLSDPMDYSLPGSSIHGIFQARVLEWGAIAFSRYKDQVSLILYYIPNISDDSCSLLPGGTPNFTNDLYWLIPILQR